MELEDIEEETVSGEHREGNEERTQDPKNSVDGEPKKEIQITVFRRGQGPVDVLKAKLGGWDQDRLEVRDILDNYQFKSIYAFNVNSGQRGVPIRFNPKNGRSVLTYRPGAVISIDGEPQDSLIKPLTKILLGVAFVALLVCFSLKEIPAWIKSSNFMSRMFPPWVIALIIVGFTRLRKRTRQLLKNYGR